MCFQTACGTRVAAAVPHQYPHAQTEQQVPAVECGAGVGRLQPSSLKFGPQCHPTVGAAQSMGTAVRQLAELATDVSVRDDHHEQQILSAAPWHRVHRQQQQTCTVPESGQRQPRMSQQEQQQESSQAADEVDLPDFFEHQEALEQQGFDGGYIYNMLLEIRSRQSWRQLQMPCLLMALDKFDGHYVLPVFSIPGKSLYIVDVDFFVNHLGMLPLRCWGAEEKDECTVKLTAMRLVKKTQKDTVYCQHFDRAITKLYVYAQHLDACVFKIKNNWMQRFNPVQRFSISRLLSTCVDFAGALQSGSTTLKTTVLAPTAYAGRPQQLDSDLLIRSAAQEGKLWDALAADAKAECDRLKQPYLLPEQLVQLVTSRHVTLWHMFEAREGRSGASTQQRYARTLWQRFENYLLSRSHFSHRISDDVVPRLVGMYAWWHQAPNNLIMLMHRNGYSVAPSTVAGHVKDAAWIADASLSEWLEAPRPLTLFFDNFNRNYGNTGLTRDAYNAANYATVGSKAGYMHKAAVFSVALQFDPDGRIVNPFRDVVLSSKDIDWIAEIAKRLGQKWECRDVDGFTSAASRTVMTSNMSELKNARELYDTEAAMAYAPDGFAHFRPITVLPISTGTPQGGWAIFDLLLQELGDRVNKQYTFTLVVV